MGCGLTVSFAPFSDECSCQAPVSWEFTQLDSDYNNQLTAAELQDIEDNGYEHCVRPFIDVCDHNHDMQLSQKEWCCCFADIRELLLSTSRLDGAPDGTGGGGGVNESYRNSYRLHATI